MHYGEYIGKDVFGQSKRVLILGESHHTDKRDNKTPGVKASYETKSVVEAYFNDPTNKNFRFFDKAASSFGKQFQNRAEREDFWNKVFFGNYVDVLCCIGNDYAQKYISKNRERLNDDLFKFVNKNNVDVVVCFGRRVYNNLPSLSPEENKCEKIGQGRDYIGQCKYLPNVKHSHSSVKLKKELTVYGLRHPSAPGKFNASAYADYFAEKSII